MASDDNLTDRNNAAFAARAAREPKQRLASSLTDVKSRPYYRNHIRVCEHCESNLLIEERGQRQKCVGRNEDDEPVWAYRNSHTMRWCVSCNRNVDTEWKEGEMQAEDPTDDNHYSLFEKPADWPSDESWFPPYWALSNGFSFRRDRWYAMGSISYDGSEAVSKFHQVKSPLIDGLIKIIDDKLAIIKGLEDEALRRFMIGSSYEPADFGLDEQEGGGES